MSILDQLGCTDVEKELYSDEERQPHSLGIIGLIKYFELCSRIKIVENGISEARFVEWYQWKEKIANEEENKEREEKINYDPEASVKKILSALDYLQNERFIKREDGRIEDIDLISSHKIGYDSRSSSMEKLK